MTLLDPKQLNTIVPVQNKTIYVDKGGSDALNDGSILRPYLTIGKAMTSVPAFVAGVFWEIKVGAGVFNESVTLKPNVFVTADDAAATSITGPLMSLDATWTALNQGFSGFNNVTLAPSGLVGMRFDFATPIATNATLLLSNCVLRGPQLQIAFGDSTSNATVFNCLSNVQVTTLTNAQHNWIGTENSVSGSNLVITDTPGNINTQFSATGGGNQGTTQITRDAANAGTFGVFLIGFALQGAVSAIGGVTVTATTESIPGVTGIVLGINASGTATLAYVDYAPALGYVPGVPANWSPVPINVQQALDELAASVALLSSGISWKNPVNTISVAAIPSPPSNATTALGTAINGYHTAAGTRVALNAQAALTENGIWVVPAGAAAPWTRATDLPAGVSGLGIAFFVEGLDGANTPSAAVNNSYVQNLSGPGAPPHPVVGTDPLNWVQFGAAPVANQPTNLNKNQNPAAVPAGAKGTTGLTLTSLSKGYVIVMLNGAQQRVFNGPGTFAAAANLDCAWSTDGGVNALSNSNVPAGATLYWTGAAPGTAAFGLTVQDVLDFDYNV